ncbi:U3 small nucleolar RNA-associated protein 4, partial [Paragonimus heterotremus]
LISLVSVSVLLFCYSGVLFSGDNRGTVSVWDVTVGALLHTFPSHIAHVLTLTSSPDENTVFSGGADAIIRRYERCLAEDGQARWELAGTVRGCRRDIRGLVYLSGAHYDPGSELRNLDSRFEPHRLLAVGLDARLQVLACEQPEHGLDGLARAHFTLAYQVGRPRSSDNQGIAHVAALPFWPAACAPTRPPPACFVLTKRPTDSGETLMPKSARLCLLHYPDKLSLIRLARPKPKVDSKIPASCARHDTIVPMSEGLLQLAEVRPRKGMDIISSSLSRCGRFIAYSDLVRTRILKVTVSATENPSLPSVSIARVSWDQGECKRKLGHAAGLSPPLGEHRNHDVSASQLDASRLSGSNMTSSSETDTDTDELSPTAIAKFFALDESSASKIVSTRSPVSAVAFLPPNPNLVHPDPGLPSAHCMVFTPDSSAIILVTRETNQMCCISLETGKDVWRTNLKSDTGVTFHCHHLSISKTKKHIGFVIGLCCSDGRFRLWSSQTGQPLFTCPCLPSASGLPPLPVCGTFSNVPNKPLNVSILYTNSQLSEWQLDIIPKRNDAVSDGEIASPIRLEAKLNMWLSKLWLKMEHEVRTLLGVFHSVSYVGLNRWLLASDCFLLLLIRDKPFTPGMIKRSIEGRTTEKCCVRIAKNFQSIIQATALTKKELAVVSLYSAGLALKLSSPMQRKQFGT